MSTDDDIFLAVRESNADVARWLGEVLEMAPVEDQPEEDDMVRLRGHARSVDGWLVLEVSRNGYVNYDPEEEIQAIDLYPIDVSIWYAGRKDEELQSHEARLIFDKLIESRPEVPILLSHGLAMLTAAHLPGVGTKYFESGITLDEPDLEAWMPWVVT